MGKMKNVAVLFADDSNSGLTHDYFANVLDNFKRTIEENGYSMSFLNCSSNGKKRLTYLEQMVDRSYDGVIIACINWNNPEVKDLIASGCPIVTIDQEIEGILNITSDNIGGIKSLAEYICSMGHKRIAYIMGDDNDMTTQRKNAFLSTCLENGASIPDEYIFNSEYRNMKKAAYYTEELLRMDDPPTCILYSDDYAAIGGINILRARGMDIPHDVSVAGYDGLNIAMQFEPKLTTVHQDTKTIGQTAANKLIELIENPDAVSRDTIRIPTKLIEGRTISKKYFA